MGRAWEDALRFFGEQARREPLTLILDEFQWLKSAQGALDSIIKRHWDQWDRDGVPITLVLSGSALTLMERLLDRAAPLFGRATARPRLLPTLVLSLRRGGAHRCSPADRVVVVAQRSDRGGRCRRVQALSQGPALWAAVVSSSTRRVVATRRGNEGEMGVG